MGEGPLALAEALAAAAVTFDDAEAFTNVNTPAELAGAERRLAASAPQA